MSSRVSPPHGGGGPQIFTCLNDFRAQAVFVLLGEKQIWHFWSHSRFIAGRRWWDGNVIPLGRLSSRCGRRWNKMFETPETTHVIGDMGPMYGCRFYHLEIIGAQQVTTDHSFASWRWIIEMDHGDTILTINFSLKQYLSSAWKSSFDSSPFLFLAHNLFVVVNT